MAELGLIDQERAIRADKIVGGAKTCRYGAVGAILRKGSTHCTGTLVSRKAVLTAGHCLDDRYKDVTVVFATFREASRLDDCSVRPPPSPLACPCVRAPTGDQLANVQWHAALRRAARDEVLRSLPTTRLLWVQILSVGVKSRDCASFGELTRRV
ncbi:MAG: trypsin-like serine protease [Labilithrix sp.]|nr:trypsin-like serine protease [Labilithrix sp.]